MGVYSNIQIALDTKLASLSGSPSIAWENVAYRPTAGTSFLRPQHVSLDAERQTISDRTTKLTGTYHIDVFTEAEKGVGANNTLVDAIVSHFNGVETLTSSSTTLAITSVYRESKGLVNEWYMASVRINYFVFN